MKIKHRKYIATGALAFSALLTGCSETIFEKGYKPSLESHYLSVTPRDFEFKNGGETKTGSVKSESDWSFSNAPAWVSLTPSNGNSNTEFSITSDNNENLISRTSVFSISTNTGEWSQQRTITATQAAATPTFKLVNLENSTLFLTGEAHTITIDVETNVDDLATNIYDGNGWLSATYKNKQLTIAVGANNDNIQRSGRIDLRSTSFNVGGTINITQYRPNLSFNDITSLSFDADGGNKTVKISSEVSWTASSDESWIEIQPSNGTAGDTQINISVLPSYQSGNRIGQVLLYYKDNQSSVGSISISQSGRYLNLSPNTVNMQAETNSQIINIDSNIGWEVGNSPEWISFSQRTGDAGKVTITITAQENNSLNSRSGTFTIKDSMTGGIESSISVVQQGLDISDIGGDTTLEFNWHAESKELDIPFPQNWIAETSDSWITLSESSGNGSQTIMVYASKNESEDVRSGKISLTSEGKTIEVIVVQTGQYLTIDNTSGEFGAMGGNASLTVSSSINTTWDVEYSNRDDNWVHIENNNDTYLIKVDYNPSINERNATFKVMPSDLDTSDKYSQGVKYTIKQSGRQLSADVSKIVMSAKGGDSEIVHITCDGGYSIRKDVNDSWFSISHQEDSHSFYLTISKNTSNKDRTGQVEITLTDLPEGEDKNIQIEVIQYHPTINIEVNLFDDEENWNM